MKWYGWLVVLVTVSLLTPSAWAQFGYLDPPQPQDTAHTTPDTSAAVDEDPFGLEDTTAVPQDSLAPAPEQENIEAAGPQAVIQRAHEWVRRLLFRGQFDGSHIGAYTQYQLTAWGETIGSYGPVEARIGVYYLGTTEWMGEDAEWLQITYNTMGDDPALIEYDLIVPSMSDLNKVYRALYRTDRGELKPVSFALPPDQLDYDLVDQPAADGHEEVDIYYGTFDTQKFRGSGTAAAEVLMYYYNEVRPLGLVRLGYGEEALTLTDQGSDARPRFDTPPPPRAQ